MIIKKTNPVSPRPCRNSICGNNNLMNDIKAYLLLLTACWSLQRLHSSSERVLNRGEKPP